MLPGNKVTGEPDDGKLSRPVRWGADGKGAQATSPAAYPTGIEVIDHIIVGSERFLSMKETNLF